MNPLVIYHANCADGFGAAFAAWLKFGDEAEYLPMQYGQVKEDDMETWPQGCVDRDVYILDFSLPRPVMDVLFDVAKRVVWLDHHASSLSIAEELPISYVDAHGRLEGGTPASEGGSVVIHDNNKSGALIAWNYFHPGTEVPLLIQHIDDYDRWQFKLEGTKAFQKALWSYAPWSFEQWDLLGAGDDCFTRDIYAEGKAILCAHEQNVQSVVKGATMKCVILANLGRINYPFDDEPVQEIFAGLAANCPQHLASDVGHELATQSGTFGLLWSMSKDGKIKCSLRSNGGYDVSAIAKAFGGGGHRNAAGFETDINTLMGWLE